jgi:hypothetical protein
VVCLSEGAASFRRLVKIALIQVKVDVARWRIPRRVVFRHRPPTATARPRPAVSPALSAHRLTWINATV